jgi:hypothetical protein
MSTGGLVFSLRHKSFLYSRKVLVKCKHLDLKICLVATFIIVYYWIKFQHIAWIDL